MAQLTVQLLSPSSYKKIYEETKDQVELHHINAALNYYLNDRLEGVELNIFEVIGEDGQKLYGVTHELLKESVKFLINTVSWDEQFVCEATVAILAKAHSILNKYDSFYSAYIRRDIREIMISYFSSNPTHPFRPMDEPNNCFYSTNEQCQKLLAKEIQLPDDYYFIILKEEHAQQICDEQIYTSKADEKFVELRIRNFPAVGVACKSLGDLAKKPGNLACYEYSDGLGVISLLYCQRQHRGKGLAKLVEEKICQRNLIEQGVRPFKGVSINRPRVGKMSFDSYLWTVMKDQDANNELYYCSLWCREDRPKVVIYED